ncbi:MAG: manganese efflux pump [Candidatus Riflebacteria bacterium]|nr:manganese efflux pump [Candidatus Riflebacteria bacterium]
MSTVVLLGISVGLAMDALAVAIATSVGLGRVSARQTFRLAFHFGLFQALMPIMGWFAGHTVEPWIKDWDHWLAFGLLSGIGFKAIRESLGDDDSRPGGFDPTRGWSLVVLSVATSVDALAVGLSFAALGVKIWYPSLVIGLVCAAVTTVGMRVGSWLGRRFGHRMELMGGLVLIAIGVHILAEHLGLFR